MDTQAYIAPLAVTRVYLGVYYALMVNLLFVKQKLVADYTSRGEKYDRYFNTDRVQLAADRKIGNMLEHMAPFVALMWRAAVFAGPMLAAAGGAVYTLARAAYPFLIGPKMGRGVSNKVLYATFTGYGVLLYFFVLIGLAMFAPDILSAWTHMG